MSDDIAIKVDHVSKDFKLPHEKVSSIKSALINFARRKKGYEIQHVLDDVSFEIRKGEFFGIVGRNGSGKSTLLKLLAGIYTPTKGNIQINGKLTPFIELGVGFNPELTGRENVFLNGALLGFDRKEMNTMYQDIVDFAELEKFMDQKLKNYSSGMQVRLAFSIAIRAKSDILLIDEVLAVGDAAFQTKCFDYFNELKNKGTTVVFVSHDRGSLERFCERGVLVNEGKLLKVGPISGVLNAYSQIVLEELSRSDNGVVSQVGEYDKSISVDSIKTLDSSGRAKHKFIYGERVTIEVFVAAKKDVINPIIGVTIWGKNVNKAIFATNTLIEGFKKSGHFTKGDTATFKVSLPSYLNDGEYYVEPAIANESVSLFYDQIPKALTFYINGSKNPHSIFSADPNTVEYEASCKATSRKEI